MSVGSLYVCTLNNLFVVGFIYTNELDNNCLGTLVNVDLDFLWSFNLFNNLLLSTTFSVLVFDDRVNPLNNEALQQILYIKIL